MTCHLVPIFDNGLHVAVAQVFIDESNNASVGLVTPDLEDDWTTGDAGTDSLIEFLAADKPVIEIAEL